MSHSDSSQTIIIADAFSTDRPFSGNPAAICVLPTACDDNRWMQGVAGEMNLSETAFVHPVDEGFRLRWFTPTVEVDLCGHATLATAHVLWSEGHLDLNSEARFVTNSGPLSATRDGDWITLDFPAEPQRPVEVPDQLSRALGTEPVYVGKNRFDLLAEVESEQVLRSLSPDFQLLAEIPVRGVIATSRCSSGEYDIVSRFFAPNCGVNEDPVCGSAHCCLTPYWSEKLGKDHLLAYQASHRGGILQLQNAGTRVHLSGRANTVMRGHLTAGPANCESSEAKSMIS